jgi:choline monooxygenase
MFVHSGKLPHLLEPKAYFDPAWFEREQTAVFSDSWQAICPSALVARSGQRFARTVLGVPIVVWNCEGTLYAFRNVCAHRHSQIVQDGPSCGERLQCQIHGWEYGPTGELAHLPDGRSFRGLKAVDYRIGKIAVEKAGAFVFVNLARNPGSLTDHLGAFAPEYNRFYDDLRIVSSSDREYPVNWKVVCENAVESYHVPMVHTKTYEDYRPEELHDHSLAPTYSRYGDLLPYAAEKKLESLGFRAYTWLLINNPTYKRFTHVHLFPNHLFYFGDIYSDLRLVEPLSAERCRILTWSFVPANVRLGLLGRLIQDASMLVFLRMGKKIGKEDSDRWPPVQAGIRNSTSSGILSAREERVYALQQYVADRLRNPSGPETGGEQAAPAAEFLTTPSGTTP